MSPLQHLSSARPAISGTDPQSASDAELLLAARAGDTTAFAEIYHRHEPSVRRCARSYRPSAHPADLDDMVSDAFTKLLSVLQTNLGPKDNPVAYLIATVRNASITKQRRQVRTDKVVASLAVLTPALAVDDEPLADPEIVAAMLTLAPRHRLVLWWTEVEGRQPREFASNLGISADAAAALSYRARRAFGAAYEAQIAPAVA